MTFQLNQTLAYLKGKGEKGPDDSGIIKLVTYKDQ